MGDSCGLCYAYECLDGCDILAGPNYGPFLSEHGYW